jgi:N-acetylglucosamine-6-phosphate deacetylase
MLLITNGTVYTPTGPLADGAVLVDAGVIRAVGRLPAIDVPRGTKVLDAGGGHIAAGFIDLHIHGALGCDLMNSGPDEFARVTAYLPQTGVTAFVPAILTAPFAEMLAALDRARAALAQELPGAQILGVHVEGPYLNVEQKGAHRADALHAPDAGECAALLAYADIIRIVTLAPELSGALDLIGALSRSGIMVSAGHTMAIDHELAAAVEAGLRHVTHLFGNMGGLRRENLTRVAGTIETALYDDRLTTEIIGDGYHISPTLMKLACKAKGPERLAIVTDASPLMGMPPGLYEVWGIAAVLEGDISYLPDRSAFAGSVVPLHRCLRTVVERTGISLADGLRMVSATPAGMLGIGAHKGSLEPGKDADIVILDAALDVTYTVIGGEVFFAKDKGDHGKDAGPDHELARRPGIAERPDRSL